MVSEWVKGEEGNANWFYVIVVPTTQGKYNKNDKMADASRMEKVDMSKEFNKLGESDKYYIRKLEKMNLDRAKELRGLRNRNRFTALFLGIAVFSICILESKVVKNVPVIITGTKSLFPLICICKVKRKSFVWIYNYLKEGYHEKYGLFVG